MWARVLNAALDAALAEVARQGGPDYLLKEAKSEGLTAASVLADRMVNDILLAVCQTHDGKELWAHTRRDPDAFRQAVRLAIGLR